MLLPIFKDENVNLMLMQTKWTSILNPLISNESNNSSILKGVKLLIGNNVINHRLGRKLVGWKVIRQRAASSIYDNQDLNSTPELTLVLNSDAVVTVDLEVL